MRIMASKKLVEFLLTSGADPDHQTQISILPDASAPQQCDKSALHFACEDGNVDLVRVLLEHKADLNILDRSHETPLHKVVRCSSCASQTEIASLLCNNGADVNVVNKMDCTPMYLSVFYGCEIKTKLLINNGADINHMSYRENSYGSPLHIASAKELLSMANLLISQGAILDSENNLQLTALQLNIMTYSKSSLAQILIYHGAEVNGFDRFSYSLVAIAIRDLRLDCESLARVMVYAGYNLQHDTWLYPDQSQQPSLITVPIPYGRVRTLCDWLRTVQTNPLPLYDLCRISTRAHIKFMTSGCSIVESISHLPLPNTVKDFLLLNDLCTDGIDTGSGAKSCIKI